MTIFKKILKMKKKHEKRSSTWHFSVNFFHKVDEGDGIVRDIPNGYRQPQLDIHGR